MTRSRPRATSMRPIASIRAGSISPTSSVWPSSPTGSPRALQTAWRAFPPGAADDDPGEPVLNPADRSDVVGFTRHARADEIAEALGVGDRAAPALAAIPPSERAAIAAPRRRPHRGAKRSARRPHRARGRQVLRQCGRRSARGGRLPALLRPRGGAHVLSRLPCPARPRRLHQSLELSARDLHRPDRRRAGGGQFGDRQAGRRDAPHRRRSRARAA